MKRTLLWFAAVSLLVFPHGVPAAEVKVSDATQACIECHTVIHPGIVQDWQESRHSQVTPGEAMAVKGLGLKVSSTDVPEKLQGFVVGCAECHTLRPKEHADTFEHNGYEIHIVVSPGDCRTCHAQEAQQYTRNLMSHAYKNLAGNKVYQDLEQTILGGIQRRDGKVTIQPANAATQAEACYYCHGTRLKVTGTETRNTSLAGELQFPKIDGWPNQGVGRVNLDGTLGSCAACHTRHRFSIEMARKPYTCKECHVGPDVPVNKVYEASKHGTIFSTHNTGLGLQNCALDHREGFLGPDLRGLPRQPGGEHRGRGGGRTLPPDERPAALAHVRARLRPPSPDRTGHHPHPQQERPAFADGFGGRLRVEVSDRQSGDGQASPDLAGRLPQLPRYGVGERTMGALREHHSGDQRQDAHRDTDHDRHLGSRLRTGAGSKRKPLRRGDRAPLGGHLADLRQHDPVRLGHGLRRGLRGLRRRPLRVEQGHHGPAGLAGAAQTITALKKTGHERIANSGRANSAFK